MTERNALAAKEKEQVLFKASEQGLRAAAPLLSWFRAASFAGDLRLFDIAGSKDYSAQGFFDEIVLDGQHTTTMGCIQRFVFRPNGSVARGAAPTTLPDFVHRRFLDACRFTHEDNTPGGIGFRPLLSELKGSGTGHGFLEPGQEAAPDLESVGSCYDWITYQIDIYDFVRNAPLVRRAPSIARALSHTVKEQLYATISREYMSGNFPANDSTLDACEIGYAFVPLMVHPTIFGYGPGRFGCGFKLWRFALLVTGEIEVRLVFISAPRSERILDFSGFDPVYGLVHLVDRLTFGRTEIRRRVHDRLDKAFLSQHAVCHEKALERMRPVFENTNWVAVRGGSSGANQKQTPNMPASVPCERKIS